MNETSIYVDLDMLLDTRVGVIRTHWEDRLLDIAKSDYRERETDEVWKYCGVNENDWNNRWASRGLLELSNSIMTEVPLILNQLIQNVMKEQRNDPLLGRVEITINTFPYQLNDGHRNGFEVALSPFLGYSHSIRFISIPPEALTPTYISKTWKILFMYDFLHWLNVQHKMLESHPIPSQAFYVPRLREPRDVEVSEFSDDKGVPIQQGAVKNLDPFDALRLTLVCCLDLHFLSMIDCSELRN